MRVFKRTSFQICTSWRHRSITFRLALKTRSHVTRIARHFYTSSGVADNPSAAVRYITTRGRRRLFPDLAPLFHSRPRHSQYTDTDTERHTAGRAPSIMHEAGSSLHGEPGRARTQRHSPAGIHLHSARQLSGMVSYWAEVDRKRWTTGQQRTSGQKMDKWAEGGQMEDGWMDGSEQIGRGGQVNVNNWTEVDGRRWKTGQTWTEVGEKLDRSWLEKVENWTQVDGGDGKLDRNGREEVDKWAVVDTGQPKWKTGGKSRIIMQCWSKSSSKQDRSKGTFGCDLRDRRISGCKYLHNTSS